MLGQLWFVGNSVRIWVWDTHVLPLSAHQEYNIAENRYGYDYYCILHVVVALHTLVGPIRYHWVDTSTSKVEEKRNCSVHAYMTEFRGEEDTRPHLASSSSSGSQFLDEYIGKLYNMWNQPYDMAKFQFEIENRLRSLSSAAHHIDDVRYREEHTLFDVLRQSEARNGSSTM